MNKGGYIEAIDTSNLSDQTKYEINKAKDYFHSKMHERKITSKKYFAVFDYIDKTLIVLSETSGGVSIISFASVIGVPAGLTSAIFTFVFSLTTGLMKKRLKTARNIIFMLAESKLNSIETLMSQALIDLETSHEELKTIVNEK